MIIITVIQKQLSAPHAENYSITCEVCYVDGDNPDQKLYTLKPSIKEVGGYCSQSVYEKPNNFIIHIYT